MHWALTYDGSGTTKLIDINSSVIRAEVKVSFQKDRIQIPQPSALYFSGDCKMTKRQSSLVVLTAQSWITSVSACPVGQTIYLFILTDLSFVKAVPVVVSHLHCQILMLCSLISGTYMCTFEHFA
jgi:hypothetical protein